jgi:hypothetical protein
MLHICRPNGGRGVPFVTTPVWGAIKVYGKHQQLDGESLGHCYLSMKEGSLFCLVVMRSTEPGCFRLRSLCLGGVHGLGSMTLLTCSAKVLEYWMISSLKIKLNRSWKFGRNWNVPLVLLERSRWERFK